MEAELFQKQARSLREAGATLLEDPVQDVGSELLDGALQMGPKQRFTLQKYPGGEPFQKEDVLPRRLLRMELDLKLKSNRVLMGG